MLVLFFSLFTISFLYWLQVRAQVKNATSALTVERGSRQPIESQMPKEVTGRTDLGLFGIDISLMNDEVHSKIIVLQ